MKPQRKILSVLTTGFIVAFFWCVGIYWSDSVCNQVASNILPALFSIGEPPELNIRINNQAADRPATISCYFNQDAFFEQKKLGITRFNRLFRDNYLLHSSIFDADASGWINFIYDTPTKQIFVCRIDRRNDIQTRKTVGYIGPKGYSHTKNIEIGTFQNPLFSSDCVWTSQNPDIMSLLLYDIDLKQFYRIEMNVVLKKMDKYTRTLIQLDTVRVIEGPAQNQPDWNPVQAGRYLHGIDNGSCEGNLKLTWDPPKKFIRQFRPDYAEQYAGIDPNTMPDSDAIHTKAITLENATKMQRLKGDLFVLHQNGRIDYLDGKTLNITRCAGYLPEVGFYQNSKSRRFRDMADYEAFGFYDPNEVYHGMAVGAVSRDGTTLGLDFYNAQGKRCVKNLSGEAPFHYSQYDSAISLLMDSPPGSLYLVVRYLLENIQSPLLRLLDMPAAAWMEPDERYGTFFVHPNSLVGLMKFEYDRFGFWIQLVLLMLPSLAVSLWLGTNARQKAGTLGYDKSAIDGWFIAVLAFGIPAYITFKLMLPQERMVTCANCGNPRRVEFENCQSCKRDWQKTKTLTTPPDWSVKDTGK